MPEFKKEAYKIMGLMNKNSHTVLFYGTNSRLNVHVHKMIVFLVYQGIIMSAILLSTYTTGILYG